MDNIIDHVYNDIIYNKINYLCYINSSKLIAMAIAAHNNAIDWNSTINDNDVIPQNELNTRIDNLVRVIYRNVDPRYSRTSFRSNNEG